MAVAKYDIEKFDGKRDFTLSKAKIKAIVSQQKTLKALTNPEKLPKTMTQGEKETMKNVAYGAIVLNLSDNVLREVKQLMECGRNWKNFISLKTYLTVHM